MNESGFFSPTVETTPTPEAQGTLPWPPPPGASVIGSFVRTWTESLFRPGEFFSKIPETGDTGAAVLYYGIVGMIAAVFGLFWNLVIAAAAASNPVVGQVAEALDLPTGALEPIVVFLFTPVILALLLAVAFAVVHVCLLIFGGARRGAGVTLRVLCYAYGPTVFAAIPYIGPLVGYIWMVVLAIVGLTSAHRTDGWRAALAVLLPLAGLFAFVVFLAMILAIAAVGMSL